MFPRVKFHGMRFAKTKGGNMRKRLVLFVFVAVLCLPVMDARAAADAGFVVSDPALAGDICYDFRAASFGYGPSYTFGSFGKNQMFLVKGMWAVFPDDGASNKLGVGLALDVSKALKSADVTTVPDWFNACVGVLVLVDAGAGVELSLGVYATLINVPL